MIKPFTVSIIFFSFIGFNLFAQTALPGGVKGAKIWLKTSSNSTNQLGWTDQLAATPKIKQSFYPTVFINHNPVLKLDAAKTSLNPILDDINLAQATIFTVYQAMGKEKILWHLVEDEKTKVVLTTHRLSDLSNYEYLNFEKVQPNVPTINTYFHHSGANKKGINSHLQLAHLPKDQNLPIQAFNGAFAEIIVFDRVLDEEDRLKVSSYLAIKYGLTIQNSSNQTYLNSVGKTIWKTPFGQANFHRITGIGRDNNSQLNQAQSASSYDPDFLNIQFKASDENKWTIPDQIFLLWGDNDAALTFAKANRFQAKLLKRHWMMQVTNTANSLPTTLILNPKSLHLQPKKGETFWLVMDSTANGQFQPEHLVYHPLSPESSNAQLIFDGIIWDVDHSGSDGFTIAIGPKILEELSPEELATLNESPLLPQQAIPQFDVYPNPSTDGAFQVKIRPNTLDVITLKIHNALGQEILQQSFSGKEYYFYENQLTQNGLYFLTITENEEAYSRKLVVDGK